jgi:hypothetical protein
MFVRENQMGCEMCKAFSGARITGIHIVLTILITIFTVLFLSIS